MHIWGRARSPIPMHSRSITSRVMVARYVVLGRMGPLRGELQGPVVCRHGRAITGRSARQIMECICSAIIAITLTTRGNDERSQHDEPYQRNGWACAAVVGV